MTFNGSVMTTDFVMGLVRNQENDPMAADVVRKLRDHMESNFVKMYIYFESTTMELIDETPRWVEVVVVPKVNISLRFITLRFFCSKKLCYHPITHNL